MNLDQGFPSPTTGNPSCLILSAHDVAGLFEALYPACVGSKTSANPSTAGSSTLVSDSFRFGGIFKSAVPSVSELSGISDQTSVPGTPHVLDNVTQDSGNAGAIGTAFSHNQPEFSPNDWEYQLTRVYDCLASILQSDSAISNGGPASEWTFFKFDTEGKSLVPSNRAKSAGDQASSFSNEDGVSQGGTDQAAQLQSYIIHLLSQRNLDGNAFLPSRQPAKYHVMEMKHLLSNWVREAIDQAASQYDHQRMHYWWQMQRLLQGLKAPADTILKSISSGCEERIEKHRQSATRIEKQLHTALTLRRLQDEKLRLKQEQRQTLRMKMWYVSDVRHSSTFEDALHVSQALRAMANTPRSKHASGMASWARQRLKNVSWQDRSVAQTVEALTEPSEYSGTCKLNDDQVERTSRWFTCNSVENFCRCEERIQRFCFEIQRCVNILSGPTLLESPVLWSSRLFEQERKSFDRRASELRSQVLPNSKNITSPLGQYLHSQWKQSPQGDQTAMIETLKSSPISHGLSPKEPVRSLPPHTFPKSAPLPDPALLSHSPNLRYRRENQERNVDAARALFATEIKRELYSLMLSDLGYLLWHSGSETDSWVRSSSVDEDLTLPDRQHKDQMTTGNVNNRRGIRRPQGQLSTLGSLDTLFVAAKRVHQDPSSRWLTEDTGEIMNGEDRTVAESIQGITDSFPYRKSYKEILQRFSTSQDPQFKLRMLHELEHLVSYSIKETTSSPSVRKTQLAYSSSSPLNRSQSIVVPRTKATSFEEVIANCTERRAGTLRINQSQRSPLHDSEADVFGTDEIVEGFLSIFRDLDLRPSTLFRDLQYIAAFVPAEILDQTPQGKAFWDAGLAALALKEELCDAMVARATDITNYHISASASSPDPPSNISRDKNLAHTTLQDAARLWTVAAKEGSATAARELGLLYLTHPLTLPRTTLQPFSKPKEVFRMVGARKEGSAATEEGRLDPVTFAVVFHWMEVAANGGDRDARDFLRGNGEWNMGR
ncbi:MAG: hypothetical protein Q9219_004338 [cf. Caloplaca sp. 3 TL-2023]